MAHLHSSQLRPAVHERGFGGQVRILGKWWAVTVSNRRPSRCKRDALPTELTAPRRFHRGWMGFLARPLVQPSASWKQSSNPHCTHEKGPDIPVRASSCWRWRCLSGLSPQLGRQILANVLPRQQPHLRGSSQSRQWVGSTHGPGLHQRSKPE